MMERLPNTDALSQQEELKTLLVRTAELLEHFRRQSQEASLAHHASAARLEHLSSTAPDTLRQATENVLGNFTAGIGRAVTQGLEKPVSGFDQKVHQAGDRISGATLQSLQAAKQLQDVVGRLWMLSLGVSLVLLLALIASTAALWHYRGVINDNQLQAELLQAYNRADVTLCDGRLCANVDKDAKKYGEKDQYQPVKPR